MFRTDLHPLLVAPAIGAEVTVRLRDGLARRLEDWGQHEHAQRVRALIGAGTLVMTGVVVFGIGHQVRLSDGCRIEVCHADHLVHVRGALGGDTTVGIPAQDLVLDVAPVEAERLLGGD